MKPSDLSIGFWVRLVGTQDYFQIEEMFTVETVRRKRIMLGGRDSICGYVYYYLDEIEPVPLDGKILKKNGFIGPDSSSTFTHSYGGSEKKTAEVEIVLSYDLINNEWIGEFFGPWAMPLQLRIHYVHELQRIMRCLGIDHDIVL